MFAFCIFIFLENRVLPRSSSLYLALRGTKVYTKLSCDWEPCPLKGENLQNKLYITSEDRKSFNSVPLMCVILNKELLLRVTRAQGQVLSREIRHVVIGQHSALLPFLAKTKLSFCSPLYANSSTLSHKARGHFSLV